ncbi:MAG: penicillin-binding protein 2, partial [Treponema porcinum]|nr:penicillin-binding protein 2 [Treponema porcinum]
MAFSFRNGRGLRKGSSLDKTSRIFLLGILIFFGFVVYFYRLFYLQVIQGAEYRTQSKTISSQVNTIPAQRGEIFDRNANLPMVINTESFAVEITPGEIPSGMYDTVVTKLASMLGISKYDIDKKIPKNIRRSYATVQIRSNVPFS